MSSTPKTLREQLVNFWYKAYRSGQRNDDGSELEDVDQLEALCMKRETEAVDAILDQKMRQIDKMISDFIHNLWPEGNVLRASEIKKPIDYDPLVRQIRDFARGNAYGNRILDRAISKADQILDKLTTLNNEEEKTS